MGTTVAPVPSAEAAGAEWAAGEALADLLPLRFPSGCVLDALDARCPRCGGPIAGGDARVSMGRPTGEVATFRGWCLCRPCNLLTRLDFRVRDGLRVEWDDSVEGWVASSLEPPTLVGRLALRLLRRAGLA